MILSTLTFRTGSIQAGLSGRPSVPGVAAARAVLGEARFTAAWTERENLTLEQSLADALEEERKSCR
jgi:hypothetical protein